MAKIYRLIVRKAKTTIMAVIRQQLIGLYLSRITSDLTNLCSRVFKVLCYNCLKSKMFQLNAGIPENSLGMASFANGGYMKRFLFAICLTIILPLVAQAYTLVLKDGKRIEVREQYRIVNNVAVFTLPEGNRFSLSLDKINIAATEMANGIDSGMFVKNSVEPPKVAANSDNSDNKETTNNATADENEVAMASRPATHKLTNNDFERYRVRREEMNRDANDRAAGKAAAQLTAQAVGGPPPSSTPPGPTPERVKEEAAYAARREQEKKREEYWRTRSRALLTQMRVEEEQLNILQAQLEETRRAPQTIGPSVSVYSQRPVYPYPGVIIGGIPIGVGRGGNTTGGGSVVVINNQNQQQPQGKTLQERLVDLQLQHQSTLIQYDEMCEEARRDGALPGWLR